MQIYKSVPIPTGGMGKNGKDGRQVEERGPGFWKETVSR